jgi:hypothetical protein
LNPNYDGTNKYYAEPHTLIYNLIRRQQMYSNIFDKLLADSQNDLALERHKMINSGKENDILIKACFFKILWRVYEIFKHEYEQSSSYRVEQ